MGHLPNKKATLCIWTEKRSAMVKNLGLLSFLNFYQNFPECREVAVPSRNMGGVSVIANLWNDSLEITSLILHR